MTGIEMIVAERRHQIDGEGWTPEHDDEHTHEELVGAAICYAANKGVVFDSRIVVGGDFRAPVLYYDSPAWPWDGESDKRAQHGRLRSLAVAGALIAAEIDRLQRAGVVE